MNDYVSRCVEAKRRLAVEGGGVLANPLSMTDEAREYREALIRNLRRTHPDGPVVRCWSCDRYRRLRGSCKCGTMWTNEEVE